MATETIEAKETLDEVADKVFDAHEAKETETPEETSSSENQKKSDAETKPAGAEPVKTEQVEKVEADESLSPEDKISKISEILGDDADAVDAYIKSKGFHTDPAWIKQREQIEGLKTERDEALKKAPSTEELEKFNKVTSSPEYIRLQMKSAGYTEETIDNKLKELGHTIPDKPNDDVALVAQRLNIDLEGMEEGQRTQMKDYISDITKVADVIIQDRLGKVLPGQLKPLQDALEGQEQAKTANDYIKQMQDVVKVEDILDFAEDVEPEIDKWMEKNPEATQDEIFSEFGKINHKLTIERLRTKGKKDDRDIKKGNLRSSKPGARVDLSTIEKTGDFDKDADAFLDAKNVQ